MSSGKVNCTCGWSWNKSDSSAKDMYICHECGRDNSNNMKNGGWLDNYNDSQASAPEGMVGDGFSNVGRNYSPAWGGSFQGGGSVYPVNYVPQAAMGASMPGAVGFSYARTQGAAPSNGKYTKKTMASAKDGGWLDGYEKAQNGVVFDKNGKRVFPNIKKDLQMLSDIVKNKKGEIKSEDRKTNFPLIKIKFDGKRVTEYPIAQTGKDIKLKNKKGEVETINTASPEYEELYKAGDIQSPDAGEGDVPYFGGELPEVVLQQQMTPLLQAKRDYGNFSNEEAFTNRKKDEYLKSLGSSNWFGADRNNFPENVLRDINAEYNYNKNTKAIEDVARAKGFDLNTRGNWIYDLTPGEREALINSKYSAQLNPNEFAEMASGVQQLANTMTIGKPWDFDIPGLTERELEEDRESLLSPLKTFAPLNIPGNAIANYLKNDSDYVENPLLGTQRMAKMQVDLKYLENYPKYKQGGIIKDDRGQWNHPGEITEIGSNQITMQGVPYPVLGISDTGDTKLMKPGKNYKFKGKKVTEFPMAKNGIRKEQKGLVNLDNLLNFTNYNTKQPGGWLDNL